MCMILQPSKLSIDISSHPEHKCLLLSAYDKRRTTIPTTRLRILRALCSGLRPETRGDSEQHCEVQRLVTATSTEVACLSPTISAPASSAKHTSRATLLAAYSDVYRPLLCVLT